MIGWLALRDSAARHNQTGLQLSGISHAAPTPCTFRLQPSPNKNDKGMRASRLLGQTLQWTTPGSAEKHTHSAIGGLHAEHGRSRCEEKHVAGDGSPCAIAFKMADTPLEANCEWQITVRLGATGSVARETAAVAMTARSAAAIICSQNLKGSSIGNRSSGGSGGSGSSGGSSSSGSST